MSDLDLNMRGGRLKHVGQPKEPDDIVRIGDVEEMIRSCLLNPNRPVTMPLQNPALDLRPRKLYCKPNPKPKLKPKP